MALLERGSQPNLVNEWLDGLCPAEQLVLCGARTTLSERQKAKFEHLARAVGDWSQVRALAQQHGTFPLLFVNLEQHCADAVPPELLAQLREDYRANAWRSLIFTGELTTLLGRLEGEQIAAIAYKGPTLASLLYGSISWRQFIDLDILVREADIAAAQKLIVESGYEEVSHLGRKPTVVEHALKFVNPQSECVVELHWRVTPGYIGFPLDFSELWERAQEVALGGATVVTFAPEDLLLVLCIHGYRHNWRALKWICDVNEFIRAYPALDWERTLARAERLGSKLTLLLGLRLSHDLFDTELPETIQLALEGAKLERSVAQVAQRLFLTSVGGEEETDKIVTYLEMRERLPDKVRYLRFMARAKMRSTTGREGEHPQGSVAYYVARLAGLLRSHGVSPLVRLLRTLRS